MDWDCPWRHIQIGETDPILELNGAFEEDPNPEKINVGVGAYRNDESLPVVFGCVRRAEKELLPQKYRFKEYAPMDGLPEFCELSRELIYGKEIPADKVPFPTCLMMMFVDCNCPVHLRHWCIVFGRLLSFKIPVWGKTKGFVIKPDMGQP